MMINCNWQSIKQLSASKGIPLQYVFDDDNYFISLVDGAYVATCCMARGQNDDCLEFESNFKDHANSNIKARTAASSPINEHCLQPFGCIKGYFKASDYARVITLSNKLEDGKTFTYSDDGFAPAIGNYVFQNHSTVRSWITSVNIETKQVTFEHDILENSVGRLARPYLLDCKVEDWASPMYLWGMIVKLIRSNETNEPDDFIETSIVDKYDFFKSDEACAQIFADYGVTTAEQALPYILANYFEDFGEFGHWTKYYDESWSENLSGKELKTPDGAPGELIPGFWIRIAIFPAQTDDTMISVYVDHIPTSKE